MCKLEKEISRINYSLLTFNLFINNFDLYKAFIKSKTEYSSTYYILELS